MVLGIGGFMGNTFKHFTLAMMSLSLVAACGNELQYDTDNADSSAGTGQTAAYRICEDKVNNATATSLGHFFAGRIVRNMEGPATWCLEISRGIGNSAKGKLRVEYEDDFGITYVDLDDVYFGELKANSATSLYSLDMIFITEANLVRIKGTENASNIIEAEIKSFTFLSFEDELTAQLQAEAEKCKTGQLTVAQCLGYNFPPVMWWNQPLPLSPQDEMVKAAKDKLDSSAAKTLGTIKFDIADVIKQ